jgi:hypothetical protein
VSVEAVVQSLLNVAGITAVVGTNVANVQLPEDSNYPALVYTVISTVPVLPIRSGESVINIARVQFDCMARDLVTARLIREAVKAAVNYQRGVIGGTMVVSITFELEGTHGKDPESKIFTIPVDYMVTFYGA